jgi:hypothetical protein
MGELITSTCSNLESLWASASAIWLLLVHLRTAVPSAVDNSRKAVKSAMWLWDLVAGNYGSAKNK